MTIKTKYKFGDTLYIKNDPEQSEYFLVGLIARPSGILYELSFLGEILIVNEFEISETKDPLKTMGIDKEEEENG